MDRKTITGLAAGAAALASGCYLAGLLAQLLRNYDLWRQAGGRLGSGASPGLPGLGVLPPEPRRLPGLPNRRELPVLPVQRLRKPRPPC